MYPTFELNTATIAVQLSWSLPHLTYITATLASSQFRYKQLNKNRKTKAFINSSQMLKTFI